MRARREPVTLRALVEGTGASTMAVYPHFGGMPGLWSAVRQEGFTRLTALQHRFITLTAAFLSLFDACALVTQVTTEFIPEEDRAEFQVNVETPTGTSLELTTAFAEALAKDLRDNGPGIEETFLTIGGGAQGQVNQAMIHVLMSGAKTRPFHQKDVMSWVRSRYGDVKDAVIAAVPISAVGGGGGFRSQAIQYNIRGRDLDELKAAADALVAELDKVEGFVDLDTTFRGGKPELAIEIDRERAAALGVPVASIATTIRALIAGDKVTELKDGLDIYDVTMQLSDEKLHSAVRFGAFRRTPG